MKIQNLKRFENLSVTPLSEPLTESEIAILTTLASGRTADANGQSSSYSPPKELAPPPEPEKLQALVELVRRKMSPLTDVRDKPATTMTVATWNLKYLSRWKATYLPDAIGEVLKKVDLVSLQEPTGSALKILAEKTDWIILKVRGSNRYQHCALIVRPDVFDIIGRTHAIEQVTHIPGLEVLQPGLRPFLAQTLRHRATNQYVSFINMHPKSNVAGPDVDEETAFLVNGKVRYQQFESTISFMHDLIKQRKASRQQIILADTNCPLARALEIEPLIKDGFFLQNARFPGATHRLGDWFDGCLIKGIPYQCVGRNFVPSLWNKKGYIEYITGEDGIKRPRFTEEQELFSMLTDHTPWVKEIDFSWGASRQS